MRLFFLNGGRDAWIVRVAARGGLPGDRARRRGLYSLEAADPVNLICLPAVTNSAVLQAAAEYCRSRRAFLIADAPLNLTPSFSDPTEGTLVGCEDAAVFWPWLLVDSSLTPGARRAAPPSGAIAGIIARTDADRGVWRSPAGTGAEIRGVQGLTRSLTPEEMGTLRTSGVCAIRAGVPGVPVVWGAVTRASPAGREFTYIAVRRMALFIEASIRHGSQWAVFEPNGEPLWASLRATVASFLHDLFRNGAFAGSAPTDAFLVRCDASTTTESDLADGVVNLIVGFAPMHPAEFVKISCRIPAMPPD